MDLKKTHLFIIAQEPSGDLHGAELVKALKEKAPSLHVTAIGGPHMRELDVEMVGKMEDFMVMGFWDVLLALPRLIRLFFRVKRKILSLNPQGVICIDYPGFNLRLERSLRKSGYPGTLIHYICPTVWAWGKKRIPILAKNLDLLLTLFPFEPASFAHTTLTVKYVGNPLLFLIQNHAYKQISLKKDPALSLVALFPGSRDTEILRNLPLQLQAVKGLPVQIAISCKNFVLIKKILKEEGVSTATLIHPQENYDLMKHTDFAIATSGTITLELALHLVPTIVTFAIKRWDQFLAQKIFRIDLPHYCLVNILAQKRIFPELFGTELTLRKLQKTAATFLQEEKRDSCRKECAILPTLLKGDNPPQKAAEAILWKMLP